MADEKKAETSIFKSMGDLFKVKLEESLAKARSTIAMEEDNANYQKSVHRDFTFSTGATGYHEKTTSITFEHEKMMARKNTIVAGVIKTRQNQAAVFTKPVKEHHEAGFKIVLKDEEAKLEQIIDNLKKGKIDETSKTIIQSSPAIKKSMKLKKAEGEDNAEIGEYIEDINNKDLERLAQEILKQTTSKKKKDLTQFMLTCGNMKDRPFESRKWNFDSYLRALINDTYTYDWISTEKVSEQDNPKKIHHIVPVDAATIRYASPTLANYKNDKFINAANILYPEKELEALEQGDALELDPEKVENGDYKFVQRIRGLIVRAYTPDELCVGVRNPVTDIYANGYSVSELELLANTVTAHIFTENHKRSYFSNGFSAKGILHIKAPLNRRKLEALRVQWKHMVSGPKNSFQTPIFAGMDEVQWIPLNQGNIDQEFNNWMQYLIKVICMIYQIDPSEIGFGMKEEGGSGGGLSSGDATDTKQKHSKSKGLIPLMKFLENYINVNIIDYIDSEYKLEFVGLSEEDNKASIDRQSSEIKFKKTVNEIRAEDGLPPIPGCDELILEPTYFQWFSQFSEDGKALAASQQQDMNEQGVDEQITNDNDRDAEDNQVQNNAVDEQITQDSNSEDEEAQMNEQGIGEQMQQESDLGDEQDAELQQGVMEAADKTATDDKKVKKSAAIEIYYINEDD